MKILFYSRDRSLGIGGTAELGELRKNDTETTRCRQQLKEPLVRRKVSKNPTKASSTVWSTSVLIMRASLSTWSRWATWIGAHLATQISAAQEMFATSFSAGDLKLHGDWEERTKKLARNVASLCLCG